VPRAELITEMGMPLLPAMGVTTVLNFQPLPDGRAAITGDFLLLDREVNPVARVLRQPVRRRGRQTPGLHPPDA
jgi:hypothetical protein